jgi:DNA-binding FadR family transcriptional regulator
MDQSEFFNYLLQTVEEDTEKLPALKQLSQELGISISSLREQLDVA